MPKDLNISLANDNAIGKIAAALDSKVRRTILTMIANERYSVSEISKKLNMPLSTLSTHIKLLEDASLVLVVQNPAKRGREKLISRGLNHINIDFEHQNEAFSKFVVYNIPLGSYSDCKIKASCGLADENGLILTDDTPAAFYTIERFKAQVLWFSEGYVEYRIPNYALQEKKLNSLLVSCELCSECPNYNTEWRSDITFWINGTEIGTYQSPGDMGGRQGKITPPNWSRLATQFGFLKNIIVSNEGTFIDQFCISPVKISALKMQSGDYISLRIGIKDTAKYIGGINLFGEKFGDFPQGLMVKIDWLD